MQKSPSPSPSQDRPPQRGRSGTAIAVAIAVAVLIAVVVLFFLARARGDVTTSSPSTTSSAVASDPIAGAEARRLVESGARLVDVRTPEEYEAGHIAGAVNIPIRELDGRLGELAPKEQPIVVYCKSGNRSGRAARMLKDAGYRAVHDLGGMTRW